MNLNYNHATFGAAALKEAATLLSIYSESRTIIDPTAELRMAVDEDRNRTPVLVDISCQPITLYGLDLFGMRLVKMNPCAVCEDYGDPSTMPLHRCPNCLRMVCIMCKSANGRCTSCATDINV